MAYILDEPKKFHLTPYSQHAWQQHLHSISKGYKVANGVKYDLTSLHKIWEQLVGTIKTPNEQNYHVAKNRESKLREI
jgi:hypothetical protein